VAKKSKARRDIEDLVGSYGDAVTRRDHALWRSLWADDATWLLGDLSVTGIAAVVTLYENAIKPLQFVAHVAFPVGVHVEGEAARGRWYVQEVVKPQNGPSMLLFGMYNDHYRRIGEKWRFADRRFSFLFQSALPEGATAVPLPAEVNAPFS
jgi:ketosteroid isomerase-like protein